MGKTNIKIKRENISVAGALGLLKNQHFVEHLSAISKVFGIETIKSVTIFKKEKTKDAPKEPEPDLFNRK